MEALRSFLRDNGRIHFEGGRVMTPINDNPTRAMRVVRCDETMAAVLRGERFLVFDGAMGTMLQQGLRRASFRSFYALRIPRKSRVFISSMWRREAKS